MSNILKELNRAAIRFLTAKSNRVYLIILLLIVIGLVVQAVLRTHVYRMSDFNMFLDPAVDARFRDRSPFVYWQMNSYSPFFYSVMSLFTPFARWLAITLWTLLSILCYFWTIGLVHYLIRGQIPKFTRWLLLAPGALFFVFFDNIQLGQSNLVMLFAVVLGVYHVSRNKAIKAALAIGFAIAYKTTPGLFALFLLLKKRFKAALFTLLFSAIFTILVPMLFYSPQKSIEYVTTWNSQILEPFARAGELEVYNTGSYHTNQSLDAFLVRHFTDFGCEHYGGIHCSVNPAFLTEEQCKTVGKVVKGLFLMVLVLMCVLKKPPSTHRLIYQASVFLIAILLISPASWLNHYILLLPAFIVAIHEILKATRGGKMLIVTTGIGTLMILLSVDNYMQSLSFYFLGMVVFTTGYLIHYFRHFEPEA